MIIFFILSSILSLQTCKKNSYISDDCTKYVNSKTSHNAGISDNCKKNLKINSKKNYVKVKEVIHNEKKGLDTDYKTSDEKVVTDNIQNNVKNTDYLVVFMSTVNCKSDHNKIKPSEIINMRNCIKMIQKKSNKNIDFFAPSKPNTNSTIDNYISNIVDIIKKRISKNTKIIIVGHGYLGLIAIKLIKQNQDLNFSCCVLTSLPSKGISKQVAYLKSKKDKLYSNNNIQSDTLVQSFANPLLVKMLKEIVLDHESKFALGLNENESKKILSNLDSLPPTLIVVNKKNNSSIDYIKSFRRKNSKKKVLQIADIYLVGQQVGGGNEKIVNLKMIKLFMPFVLNTLDVIVPFNAQDATGSKSNDLFVAFDEQIPIYKEEEYENNKKIIKKVKINEKYKNIQIYYSPNSVIHKSALKLFIDDKKYNGDLNNIKAIYEDSEILSEISTFIFKNLN